jgi:serine/threonine protein kinase/sugar lactone lactonase YvrE
MGMPVAQRYRLTRVIGTGGMGRVWLGHDELIDREVAIKELLLPPGLDEAQRMAMSQRAMREARAAGRLNHPGIVTVFDVVEHNGAPLIVMEYVRGGSLSDAIRTRGSLPVEQVAAIGMAILDALRVAHQAGIVHRDLKPANVLLAPDRVVITDFGIARLMGDVQLTVSGAIVGSPAFMAPEQANSQASTPASDLWSLGATLYAAVEGHPPFEGHDFMGTLAALLTKDPRPSMRAGRLTGLLNALLRKDPSQRPTADQVAAFLAGHNGGMGAQQAPVPAAGPQWGAPHAAALPAAEPQAGRSGMRRRTILLAAGGALAAIGIPSAVWYLNSGDEDPKDAAADSGNPRAGSGQGGGGGESGPASGVDGAEPQVADQSEWPVQITDHIQLTGHKNNVTSIAISPDDKLIASGDGELTEGPTTRLWDTESGKLVATLVGPPGTGGASADAVAFSPDGELLAAGGNYLGDSTRLWRVADRKLVGTLAESGSIMKSLAFSPDGTTLAGVTHTGSVTLWDVASRRVKIGLPDGDGFRNVVFSPDGKLLANGGKGNEVRLSEAASGKTVRSITDATGSDVAFSPDGKTLAVADADGSGTLQLWDVASGKSTATYDRVEDIVTTSTLFSPDGKTLASWGLGNVIHLWDPEARKIRAIILGASANVNSVVFDSSGTRIAAGGDDKTIRIWNLTG